MRQASQAEVRVAADGDIHQQVSTRDIDRLRLALWINPPFRDMSGYLFMLCFRPAKQR
jgi:hypothetical protein